MKAYKYHCRLCKNHILYKYRVYELGLFQKQPFADVLENKFSQKFRKIHRKTLVSETLFK